jgi:hypothetical protein
MSASCSSKKRKNLARIPLASSMLSHPSGILFPQLLSRASADVPALLAVVTRAREVATAMETTRVVAVLATETSIREATVTWNNATLHVKDVEGRATLAKGDTLERVSRVKAENVEDLASACEHAEGFAQKITLLEAKRAVEHRACGVSEREHQEQF